MRLVKHLLEGKGGAIYPIEPSQPVLDAIRLMADKYVGALLVMDGAQLLGIVSERDYARKVILQGRSSARHAGERDHDRAGADCGARRQRQSLHEAR